MRILLDANIILTHLTGREDDYTDDVDTIMTKCSNDEIDGYIPSPINLLTLAN